jgi:nitroreductase
MPVGGPAWRRSASNGFLIASRQHIKTCPGKGDLLSTLPPFDLTEVDRLLTTTKAVRRRLDLTRPVPREVITECIRLATYAPSASNAQEWHWVVVDDAAQRQLVGDHYRKCTESGVATILAAKEAEGDKAGVRISESVLYLASRMADVPVIVIPCYDVGAAVDRYNRLLGRSDAPLGMPAAMYASILPAVWSFQLAVRSRGLGSTLTTAHQSDQATMARILGIPATWEQVALIPVAYTTGGDFRPSPRRPVEDSIVWNHYSG